MPLALEVCPELLDELDSGSLMLGGAFALYLGQADPVYATWRNEGDHPIDLLTDIRGSWSAHALAVLPLSGRDGWHKYIGATLVEVREIYDEGEVFGIELVFEKAAERLKLLMGTGMAVFDSKCSDELLIQTSFGQRFRFKPSVEQDETIT